MCVPSIAATGRQLRSPPNHSPTPDQTEKGIQLCVCRFNRIYLNTSSLGYGGWEAGGGVTEFLGEGVY